MKTLCILFLAFILNGIGFYLAYRLITWFETGRPHIEPQPLVFRVVTFGTHLALGLGMSNVIVDPSRNQ